MANTVLLIFFAADNTLDGYVAKDIHELEKVGSSDKVQIVIQVDRSSKAALRGRIEQNVNWERYIVTQVSRLDDIGETNTGDPSVLKDFVVDSVRRYPATNYALIIWSHGSGWRPEFIYEAATKTAEPELANSLVASDFGSKYSPRTQRIIFRKTLENRVSHFINTILVPAMPVDGDHQLHPYAMDAHRLLASQPAHEMTDLISKAIALDDSSQDSLDMIELEGALVQALDLLREEDHRDIRFMFIGFDACLMAGIECAYQLSGITDYIIGSEENEPSFGWRYDLLVNSIYSMQTSEQLAQVIVDDYIKGYREIDYKLRLITQSAISTKDLLDLARKLDELASALAPLINTNYIDLAKAEKKSLRFSDKDFIDLGVYLSNLDSLIASNEVKNLIASALDTYSKVVLHSSFLNQESPPFPTGLSIYFPYKESFDGKYEGLSIYAEFKSWVSFIKSYHFLA